MSPDMEINFISRFNKFNGITSRFNSCNSRLDRRSSGLNNIFSSFNNICNIFKHNSDERNRVAAAEETMAAVAMEEGDKHFNMNLDFL